MKIFDVRSDYINNLNQNLNNFSISFLPDNYIGKARFYYFGIPFMKSEFLKGIPNLFLFLTPPNSEISKKLDEIYQHHHIFKFSIDDNLQKSEFNELIISDLRKYYLELDVKKENLLPGYYPDTIKLILGSEKYKDFLEKMTGKTQGIVNIEGKDYTYFYKNDVEEYFLEFC
jgi:hypothetical protein